MTPGAPVVAPNVGHDTVQLRGAEVDLVAAVVHFPGPFCLTEFPALSVPAGFDDQGLPVGIQLIGRALDDATILQAGDAFERATHWSRYHPAL